MTEQEKSESVSELLKQIEDSLRGEIAEQEEKVEEYKKLAEQSREQHLHKKYQDQCDEIATVFEACLGTLSNILKSVRQTKANLR
jgi:hypothetical protein